jgi:hypothetical protein
LSSSSLCLSQYLGEFLCEHYEYMSGFSLTYLLLTNGFTFWIVAPSSLLPLSPRLPVLKLLWLPYCSLNLEVDQDLRAFVLAFPLAWNDLPSCFNFSSHSSLLQCHFSTEFSDLIMTVLVPLTSAIFYHIFYHILLHTTYHKWQFIINDLVLPIICLLTTS